MYLQVAPLMQLLVQIALLALVNASSFYENPEQDPILPGSLEELERKWDFEV